MGRGAHDVLVRLGELAAAVALVLAFALWRLLQGPVELDRLVPYVQRAFDQSGAPVRIAISGVRFGLDPTSHQLDLWVEGVRVSLPDGTPLANFPEMAASFSLGSLLRGQLAPTRIIVERPVLRLQRDQNGAITFHFGAQDTDAPAFGPEILDQLAAATQPGSPFALLHQISIRDAALVLDDQRTGLSWQASRVDAVLGRDADGLEGDLSFAAAIGGAMPEFHANYRYAAASRRLDLRLAVAGLDPAGLAPLSPELEPLSLAHFPISGTLRTRFDLAQGRSEGIRLDLGFGKGWVQSELLPAGALSLEQGEFHAVYAPETEQLRLDSLAFDLGGGSRVAFDGRLDGVTPELIAGMGQLPPTLAGKLGVVLSDLPVAKFETMWPRWLSRGGRHWVLGNIHDGSLDEASVQLDLAVDVAARDAEVVGVHGAMRYHDLSVEYFKGLPPAQKVSGTATLAERRLDFTPTGGAVRSVQVTGGSVQLTNLGDPVEWATIDLTLAGPLQNILEILDSKPLRYAHDVGVDPAEVAGTADTALHFKFPLIDKLKFDAVEYNAKATLTGAAFAKAALGRGITDGSLALEVARPGVHVQGNARFDGVPSTLEANWYFNPKNGLRGRYRVGLTLGQDDRRRLDINFLPDHITGPIGLDATYSVYGGGRAEAALALDLRKAVLKIEEAGWEKPSDAPATAAVRLDLANDKIVRISRIEVKAAGLDGLMAVQLGPDHQRIDRVEVQHLALGDDDVRGVVVRRPEGGWRIEIRGSRLDLGKAMKSAGKDEPAAASPPLVIDAQLGRLLLGPNREVRNLSAQLLRDGAHWQSARLDGTYPSGRKLALRFGAEPGGSGFLFVSDDLGATLGLLDISDNVVGGRVSIKGQVQDEAGRRVLRGRVEGQDFSIVHAPIMTRLLSLASWSGLVAMMSGNGIPFTSLRGDFVYSEDRLVFDSFLAKGGALGVNANGSFDLGRDRIDVQGTVVPAYTLNTILGRVPGIGELLLGGEGQGMFGASFHVTGSGTEPQVSVNPLSVLAPGFLRRLLQPNFGLPPTIGEPGEGR